MLFALFIATQSINCYSINPKKNILILHSYHQDFAWTQSINTEIIKILTTDTLDVDVEIFVEYLDSKRKPQPEIQNAIQQYLDKKYSNAPISLIITSDDNAFKFAIETRRTLFNDAPLVFCGVNNFDQYQTSLLLNETNYTGVVEGFDLKGAIDIALTLSPNATNLLIINDSTPSGIANKKAFNQILPVLKSNINYEFTESFDMDSVKNIFDTYSLETAILLLSYNRDKKGLYFDYKESGKIISSATNLPIYVVWDFYLGTGVTGGLVVSGKSQGHCAAKLAQQILNGTTADSIPVITKSPNRYIFDYKQLVNNEIDRSSLPKDSILINKPKTLVSKYLYEILGLIFVITMLVTFLFFALLSNRKKTLAETNLKRISNKLSTIIETAKEGFIEFDMDGKVVNVNQEFLNIIGIDRYAIKNFTLEKTSNTSQTNQRIIKQYTDGLSGISTSVEHRIITNQKNCKYIVVNTTPIFSSENKVIGIFAVISDITILKQKEKELIQAKNKAEQSDQLKSAFLSNMSHEIRTPMNAILGFTGLLSDDELETEQRDIYIDLIQSSGNNLMNLINDILDLSTIEAGQIEIKKQEFSVNSLLNELYITYTTALKSLKKTNIQLIHNQLGDEILMNSDYLRINQILSNLLNNAIKFTNKGTIELGCTLNHNKLTFYVIDTGIGIDKELQNNIFKRFQKIDTLKNQVFRGAGLGLSISKSLAELLNGKIWFEPNNPHGTRFYFTINDPVK